MFVHYSISISRFPSAQLSFFSGVWSNPTRERRDGNAYFTYSLSGALFSSKGRRPGSSAAQEMGRKGGADAARIEVRLCLCAHRHNGN